MLDKSDTTQRRKRRSLELNDETLRLLDELGRIHCTLREAAAVLGISESGLTSFLKANEEARDAWEDGRASGRASLRRLQAQMAETNPQMAIWLGKQLLGQRDTTHNVNVEEDGPGRIAAAKKAAEDRARITELLRKLGIEGDMATKPPNPLPGLHRSTEPRPASVPDLDLLDTPPTRKH